MKRRLLLIVFFGCGAGLMSVRGEDGWVEEGDERESLSVSTEPEKRILPLKIVHPPEGRTLPAVKSSFVYGWADPLGKLTVNGFPVTTHAGGGWLTVIPYTPGAFTIQAELKLPTTTYVTLRRVVVAGEESSFPVPSSRALQPDENLLLQAGETVVVEALGPPGERAYFQWAGSRRKVPMEEIYSNGKGIYRGFFIVPSREEYERKIENDAIKITMVDKKGRNKRKVLAPGRISRFDRPAPWVVEVSVDPAVLRAGPGVVKGEKSGYILYPPMGTRLLVTGRRGEEFRVALTSTREAWIGVKDVVDLSPGARAPRAVVSSVSVERSGRHTLVRAAVGTKVPFEVRASDDLSALDVLFYGAVSDTDWIHYGGAGGAVRRVEWFQEENDIYRLRVHLHPGRWWGYDARYENGWFVLELRRPLSNTRNPSSLAGLMVAVDAGHSSDRGSIGPTEFLEKDANWAIALCLEKKLKRAGAEVFMVRKGNEPVSLYERPQRAWKAKADLLISVHNNALPEGANPFDRNGYGVYYFQPHSFGLANQIHEAYGDLFGGRGKHQGRSRAKLRDDGLHYGNLALARTTQMPAVLTESAYMILPNEEALLKTEKFQCDCAEAMILGLKRFVRDVRERDTSP